MYNFNIIENFNLNNKRRERIISQNRAHNQLKKLLNQSI